MFSASEPATPTVPAPAPETDVALRRCVPSPETPFIAASTASWSEVTAPPLPTFAEVVTLARLIATAAPMPSAPAPTTLPSAFAFASVSPVAFRPTTPPAVTVTPPIVADEIVVAMFAAIAAATLTGPSEVPAGGVAVPPEPPPPGAVESARLRWLPSWLVTFDDPEEAPFALALAMLEVLDACWVVKWTSPAAARSRARDAVAVWLATVRARPAPTAAVVPVAAAIAVVVTVTAWVADALTAPVTVRAGPEPMVAPVVTFESETATSGVIPVPPAAPFWAIEVIVSVLCAVSVRSFAFARPAPAPRSACVVPLPMSSATEAPTPAFGPETAGTADAVLSVVEAAFSSTFAPPASTTAAGCSSAEVALVATFTASAPATIGLLPPSEVAPMPEVALAPELAVGARASTTRLGALTDAVPVTNALVPTLTTLTATATPVAAPAPLTGLPSAVADEWCFDPACTFWLELVVNVPPLPEIDAWVVPVSELNAIAAPTVTAPSLVFARPPLRLLGSVPPSLADAPPGLDFAVDVIVWSESALTVRLCAETEPPTDAVVVPVTVAAATPAPRAVAVASPVTVELVDVRGADADAAGRADRAAAADRRDGAARDDQRCRLRVARVAGVGPAGRIRGRSHRRRGRDDDVSGRRDGRVLDRDRSARRRADDRDVGARVGGARRSRSPRCRRPRPRESSRSGSRRPER